MIHPIPPGTRDILPDEMRELRAIQGALTDLFEDRGYGQVATPTLEYDEVLKRGDERGVTGAYRFFDERGDLLALRSDMTIPIARLVGEPLRRRRAARCASPTSATPTARSPAGRAQMRQFMHAGVELLGAPGAGGHRGGDRGAERGARRRRASTAP